MPKIDRPQPSLADVIEALETATDMTATQRRDAVSALRSMARYIGRDPDAVPANTEWLRQRLRQLHPRQLGVSEKRFQNVKSAVLTVLRMTVTNNKRHNAFTAMSPAFEALYRSVPAPTEGYKLSRLFRWCSAAGIAPEDLEDSHIAAFEEALLRESFQKNPGKVARNAVLAWNRMVASISGWPQRTLSRRSRRDAWTIPLDQFPASFQKEVDRWCALLAHDDLFDERAPLRPCRPATIAHRRFQIRMMASAIVHSGVPIAEVLSFGDIVAPARFKQGLAYILDRQGGAVTEANFTLASGLKAVARHYVRLSEEQLAELKRICSRLDQAADRYRLKNKDRLAQFDDPRNLAMLLHLPAHLEALSSTAGPKPRSADLLMQSAAAFEILLFCPMRIGNLARLDTDRHFRWIRDGRTLRLVIEIEGGEVKNGKPLRYELTGASAELIRRYCDGARQALCREATTVLFPRLDGGPRNPADLGDQLKRHCLRETGLVVNAHLFRSLAAKIHNQVSAGDTATISQVLGDRIGTVMRSYSQFEQKSALEHYQASIRKFRKAGPRED